MEVSATTTSRLAKTDPHVGILVDHVMERRPLVPVCSAQRDNMACFISTHSVTTDGEEVELIFEQLWVISYSPKVRARVKPCIRFMLSWIHRDVFEAGNFSAEDCFAVERSGRLLAPKQFNFSKDWWPKSTHRETFLRW